LDALQPGHIQAQRPKHPPHFTIAAFRQDQFDQAVGIVRRQDAHAFRLQTLAAFHHTFRQAACHLRLSPAFHRRQVNFAYAVAWMGQPEAEIAVIRQKN
jgi:hypothetical protein